MGTDNSNIMQSVIQRIATGPELSKDIAFEEARDAMQLVLQGEVSPVQAAIFFIALRMKRETDEENRGVLQAIIDATAPVTANADEVLDIADPYNGWNRGLPVAAFLPSVMAACGVPCVSHGLESVGPKYGVTHRLVLRAAGKDVDLTPQQAAKQVADTDIGWAYLDQAAYCKPLHDQVAFRDEMIKRTVLTTVEVLVGPVRGRKATHVMTGYVHKAYPPVYASLARHAGFDSALIVKGVEGSVMPSLTQAAKAFCYHDGGQESEIMADPSGAGIEQADRCVPLPEGMIKTTKKIASTGTVEDVEQIARHAAEAGLQALQGRPGHAYDSLVYAAALALMHLKRADSLQAGADRARQALNSGEARARFEATG